jgi:hypothetical protein
MLASRLSRTVIQIDYWSLALWSVLGLHRKLGIEWYDGAPSKARADRTDPSKHGRLRRRGVIFWSKTSLA